MKHLHKILCAVLILCMVLTACGKDEMPTLESIPETVSTEPTELPTTVPTTEPEQTEPKVTEPKVTEPKETEPAPTEPEVTEPKETKPKPTEPKESSDPVPPPKETEPKETEPKPTEPAPTEPKPTEPKETEPAPTEPKETEPAPTEPEREYIDCAALEAYARQYASETYGYDGNPNCLPENGAGYFPGAVFKILTMEEGYRRMREGIDAQYANDIGAGYTPYEEMDGKIIRCPINVSVVPYKGEDLYLCNVYYGGGVL